MRDNLEDYPEVRNRGLMIITGNRRGAKDQQKRHHPDMKEVPKGLGEMFGAHGEQDTKTIYAVVEDGEIGVMTEHHSVVKNYVSDSLVEGESATIDVQTFEVSL